MPSWDELAALEAAESDLRREQAKAEADVNQVRSRVERDKTRLDAGQVSSPGSWRTCSRKSPRWPAASPIWKRSCST